MKNQLCPECEQELSRSPKNCPCGWIDTFKSSYAKSDSKCQHSKDGENCQKLGTICTSPYSTSGPWFCSDHWMN